jgi:sugar diacid utilization regulator
MLDGREGEERSVARLEHAAAQWAREGVPIDTIHHSIHEGFKVGMQMVVSNATGNDFESLVDGAKLVIELLDTMTTAVSMAYVRELKAVVSEHHTAAHTLTSALLGGHSTSTMARQCGIEIAESYVVLAVSLPPHQDEHNPGLNSQVVARRKLRRVQAELATQCGETVLSLLSVDGGTILIPTGFDDEWLDTLIERLTLVAEVPITATCVESAAPAEIPDAADQVHELLDLVQRMRCAPGLYRFDDLALEYQLTRPGPGRQYLESLLNPLDKHPELLETIRTHIGNDLNRRRTARDLHVHTNTVDYRLKRIGQLTGFDPAQPQGLWYLRSALVARSLGTV